MKGNKLLPLVLTGIVHPLLTLLAPLAMHDLAQQVPYLIAENVSLRTKLPDWIAQNIQMLQSVLFPTAKSLGRQSRWWASVRELAARLAGT